MEDLKESINGSFESTRSTYQQDNLKAEVWKTTSGSYGVRFWKSQVWQKDELYRGHSEGYAEDAAENYVLGVKFI